MTELYINGQRAVLPEGFSFTFTAENPYFTRSSSYSLDIELPMPANNTIFKHINRLDVTKQKTILPAMLIVDARCLLNGSTVLLSVEDTQVKVQLVSGNAEFNLLTNDDIYIDELDLGDIGFRYDVQGFLPAARMSEFYGSVDEVESVLLPVFYQEAKEENLDNNVFYEKGTNDFAPTDSIVACWQPYLITAIRRVVEHFGYTLDLTFFDNNFLRDVYICNDVRSKKTPHVQPHWTLADNLPHWTVSDFFNELEHFYYDVTVVNEHTKEVRFVSLNDYFSNSEKIVITNDSLLREFEVEITEEKNDKDLSLGNIAYNLPSHTNDGYCRIERNILEAAATQEFDSYDALLKAYGTMTDRNKKNHIFIVGKRYYINFNDEENNTDSLREVNLYADLVRTTDSSDDISLKIVPVKIAQYDMGIYRLLPNHRGYEKTGTMMMNVPIVGYYSTGYSEESFNIQETIEGNGQKKLEKNDCMEVAFNTGIFNRQNVTFNGQTKAYDYAYPFTDYQQKPEAQTTDFLPYSLSLNDVCPDSIGHRLSTLSLFHSNIPYTIQFQANKLPDVNKVFLIGNKQYLCEKIETEIDVDGLSKVLKGTFYRIE